MATFTRKNAWNNGGTFDNPDLLWYAKAVAVMQSRPITDPTSWWFYAAIHGEYLLTELGAPYKYLNWKNIQYIPQEMLQTLPPDSVTGIFWDQCQHATWYFPPWHRGYLVAIENILRGIITEMGGPEDWALPYWNYFKDASESYIPPAFTQETLDGKPNVLYVPERYGKRIDVGTGNNEVSDVCQWDVIYSDGTADPSPTGPGNVTGYFYGGGETGFQHQDGSETGDLEDNPHNGVHGMVGGQNSQRQIGLMGVPNTAGLDPIFYLHHANIDRMWAAWNHAGNSNPTETEWLTGPEAQGNSQFVMPLDAKGNDWYYTPGDVTTTNVLYYQGSTYSYTYDDLSLTSYSTVRPTQLRANLGERMAKFGVTLSENFTDMGINKNTDLVGASNGPVTLLGDEISTGVKLDMSFGAVRKSFLAASASAVPDEVYLELEGVKGGGDANFLSIYVNGKFVKSVSLFGILSASMSDTAHGSGGLNYKFNITDIIDDMHLSGNIDVNALDVQIMAKYSVPEESKITIDRIGVYRVGQ